MKDLSKLVNKYCQHTPWAANFLSIFSYDLPKNSLPAVTETSSEQSHFMETTQCLLIHEQLDCTVSGKFPVK